jgi:hypothetical protein
MVNFIPGEWKGNPPKGQMTPREKIGVIQDAIGLDWEILFWAVEGKSAAAQVLIRENLSVGMKIFFPTEKEARKWITKPTKPTLRQIKAALRKCKWHEPSRGLIQIWVNFEKI